MTVTVAQAVDRTRLIGRLPSRRNDLLKNPGACSGPQNIGNGT
jgi:hypothetical protein